MNKYKTPLFFKSRSSLIALLILVIGSSIIQSALWFTHEQYSLNIGKPSPSKEFIAHATRNIKLATLLGNDSPTALKKQLNLFHIDNMHFNLDTRPPDNSDVLLSTDLKDINHYLTQHHQQFHISILLNHQQWLTIDYHQPQQSRREIGPLLIFISIYASLLLLYLWVVNFLSMPLRNFAIASQRFGVDLQAPPLSLQGTRETREVITAFNQMQARIRRLVENRTHMLAAISHDLRTPITRLQLRAEFLKNTDQYEKAIADLKEMEHMISSILSFARDHSTKEPMELFDLNALIETLCDNFTDTGKSVTFTSDIDRLPFEGRMLALKRAINNIIENSEKYGHCANVSLFQKDKSIIIKVVDKGLGIPEESLEKVFEPFYRVDPARSPEVSGTGLGLAVAREIIQAEGGDIYLRNNKIKGLTVTITLPAKF